MLYKIFFMVESLLFLGAEAGVGALEKIPGAGQKRTGFTTLPLDIDLDPRKAYLRPGSGFKL